MNLLYTGREFTPSQSGTYVVKIRSEFCADTSACIAFVATGFLETFTEKISIYPNPANVILQIKGVNSFDYRIVSLLGSTVKRGTNEKTISIDELESGLYFIELVAEGEKVVRRFVKE